MNKILNLYIAKSFIKTFLSLSIILIFIIIIGNYLTNVQQTAGDSSYKFNALLSALYSIPFFFQLSLPFIVLISALFFIRNISISNELDILKACGLRTWGIIKIIAPIIFLIGIIMIFVISPLGSTLSIKNNAIQNSPQSSITTTSDNFWIIDKNDKNITIFIKSKNVYIKHNIIYLEDISVFKIVNGNFDLRVDGSNATISQNKLLISNANIKDNSSIFPKIVPQFTLETNLTIRNLYNIVLEPEMLKFWEMSSFIENLSSMGLNTNKYKVYFYNLIAYPFILIAMFILGVGLALSKQKRISGLKIIIIGLIAGFSLHFFIDIINAFGSSGLIPPMLTIIGELGLIMCSGLYLIVRKEGI